MRKSLIRSALAVCLFSGASALALLASSGDALAVGKPSKAVGALLATAQKDLQGGNTADALTQIQSAQALSDLTDYDKVLINYFLAIVSTNTGNYPAGLAAAEAAADSPSNTDLDDGSRKQLFQIAFQLSGRQQEWAKCIQYAQALMTLNAFDPKFNAELSIAYYNTKDMANAQKYAQADIDASKAAGTAPNQTSLQIIANAQVGTNQAGAEQAYEQMALAYNKPDSWLQLTNAALGTKGLDETDALMLFRLRLVTGAMQHDDYKDLGTAAEQRGYPAEAVAVFQQGISSGNMTEAQAGPEYAKAHKDAAEDEHMLPEIVSSAQKSKSGEQEVKLAEDYWGYGRYADAEAAARAAIGKGGLKDPGEGPLMLGMALTMQGKYDEAIQTLNAITGSEARTKTAHLWSLYAQAKQKQAGGGTSAAAAPPAH